LQILQDTTARIAELESTNKRVVQELADFKAESKELRNQDLTIKRLEAQLGQMKAQLQNKVSRLFTLPVCALQSTQRLPLLVMQPILFTSDFVLLRRNSSLTCQQCSCWKYPNLQQHPAESCFDASLHAIWKSYNS